MQQLLLFLAIRGCAQSSLSPQRRMRSAASRPSKRLRSVTYILCHSISSGGQKRAGTPRIGSSGPRGAALHRGAIDFTEPVAALNRLGTVAALHGHAHKGARQGRTFGGVPVDRVAVPLLEAR